MHCPVLLSFLYRTKRQIPDSPVKYPDTWQPWMEGKTKRGRPKRERLDDIKEWCNEEIYILKRKAQDRVAWKVCIGHQQVMNPWNVGWTDFQSEAIYFSIKGLGCFPIKDKIFPTNVCTCMTSVTSCFMVTLTDLTTTTQPTFVVGALVERVSSHHASKFLTSCPRLFRKRNHLPSGSL